MSKEKVPQGFHSVTPYLVVKDPAEAIHFMREVFGATELIAPMHREDGTIMHAEMRVGNSPIMIGGTSGDWQPSPAMLYVYVENADEAYNKALQIGATSMMEPADQPHGDRYGMVRDSQGNQWCMAEVLEQLTEAELRSRYGQS